MRAWQREQRAANRRPPARAHDEVRARAHQHEQTLALKQRQKLAHQQWQVLAQACRANDARAAHRAFTEWAALQPIAPAWFNATVAQRLRAASYPTAQAASAHIDMSASWSGREFWRWLLAQQIPGGDGASPRAGVFATFRAALAALAAPAALATQAHAALPPLYHESTQPPS